MVETLARMERRGISIDRHNPVAPFGRIRAGHGAAGGGYLRASRARASTSARPSNWATFCSARWACPARRRPRPAPGRRRRACWKISPRKATTSRARILDWRQLSKLKSTYTDALPGFVNPRTRARPYLLCAGGDDDRAALLVRAQSAEHSGAQRGRPQNPQRLHRRAGAQADFGADYSQIELRLLAHIADIPQLKTGFRRRASTFTP